MSTLLPLAALLLYIGVAVLVVCLSWFSAYRYGRRTMREDLATELESYRLNETIGMHAGAGYLAGVDDALRIVRGEHTRGGFVTRLSKADDIMDDTGGAP